MTHDKLSVVSLLTIRFTIKKYVNSNIFNQILLIYRAKENMFIAVLNNFLLLLKNKQEKDLVVLNNIVSKNECSDEKKKEIIKTGKKENKRRKTNLNTKTSFKKMNI